jgi:hypothetical protein
MDDPSSAIEHDLNLEEYPDVMQKFEEAFALLNPIVAARLGAEIKQMEFDDQETAEEPMVL